MYRTGLRATIIAVFLVLILIFVVLGANSLAKDNDLEELFQDTGDYSLSGEDFVVSFYNDYGIKALEVDGSKIDVSLLKEPANFDNNGDFKSNVVKIVINDEELSQEDNTVIFAEKGLDIIKNYEISNLNLDKKDSDLKNKLGDKLGKDKAIIISSVKGIPIGVYQGDSVSISTSNLLPKTTLIKIDGKFLYIHKASYTVLDSKMIN